MLLRTRRRYRPAYRGGVTLSISELAYRPVDLSAHWNNRAMSTGSEIASGAFNVWRNSFPAGEMPEPGGPIRVEGVPFRFPLGSPTGDNVRCDGQYVTVPAGDYDWIQLLASAERRVESTLALHFADGQVDFEAIRVSDFWAAPAWFGETVAVRTRMMHYPHHVQPGVSATLWGQRAPVTRRARLVGIRLPRNIALHVFALTLQTRPPVDLDLGSETEFEAQGVRS